MGVSVFQSGITVLAYMWISPTHYSCTVWALHLHLEITLHFVINLYSLLIKWVGFAVCQANITVIDYMFPANTGAVSCAWAPVTLQDIGKVQLRQCAGPIFSDVASCGSLVGSLSLVFFNNQTNPAYQGPTAMDRYLGILGLNGITHIFSPSGVPGGLLITYSYSYYIAAPPPVLPNLRCA